MKFSLIKVVVCFFILMMNGPLFGQGVNFEPLTFDEALAKAKKENKLVFLDCYTEWCGPCRAMLTNVFSRKEAGDFFSPKFVCVKFNMEKGEGLELREKLGVKSYPTFFIICPNGSVQHKIVGGDVLEQFITKVGRGLDTKTSYAYLNKIYAKGKMTRPQLMTYTVVLNDAGEREKSDEIRKMFEGKLTEKDKMTTEYWSVIEKNPYGTDDFKFVLNHVADFKDIVGAETVDSYLYRVYNDLMMQFVFNRPEGFEVQLKQVRKELKTLDMGEELLKKLDLNEMVIYQDVEKIVKSLEDGNAHLLSGPIGSFVVTLLQYMASKEQLGRIAVLEDKYVTSANTEEERVYLKKVFAELKFMAHVGVYFQDLPFEDVLKMAGQQRKKRILLYCYVDEDRACRYLMDTVFKDKEAEHFVNKNFICAKYEMKEEEGKRIAKIFDLHTCPAFVILNSDGSVRHKFVGGGDKKYFFQQLDKAFNNQKALEKLVDKYNTGVWDRSFLESYVKTLVEIQDSRAPVAVKELFRMLNDEEKFSSDYWFIFAAKEYSPEGSEAEKFLLDNREKFIKLRGQKIVGQRLGDCQ